MSIFLQFCKRNIVKDIDDSSKLIPTYYLFQHVNQIMKDSSTEEIGYVLSEKEITKEELAKVVELLKSRKWTFYYNSDSTNVFIQNYTSKNEDILHQLYIIDSEN